ncbi:Do family serine endopeptidase [Acidobacteriota bacterium]
MKKTLLIASISFLLGILLTGWIFIYLPEKNISENVFEDPSDLSYSSALYASSSVQAKPNLDFISISEKVGPAVVKIESEIVETRRSSGFEGAPFDDFWDRFFNTPREREQEYRSRATGTGFFISEDGYILTNNHIVEKAQKVTVFSLQRNEYSAKIIGTDPKTDLALLKVDEKNLPFAQLGSSADVRVGEWVLAIGNPFGLSQTVTAGIVSAKGRQLGGMNVPDYQDFIQTDASINRGNSGGPLVNMRGKVIGINSIIVSPSGGNIGIGFSIPSDLAKKIVTQLKEKGRVVRGYLGITIVAIDEDTKKLLNLESKQGALVNSVEPDTPAEKAGIKRYDVITEVDGNPIEDPNDVKFKIADTPPGTKIEISIIRDGKKMQLSTKIEELESEETPEISGSAGKDLGFTVRELTSSIARRYGFQTQKGLLITEVRRYSEVERKGIERGDIILEVNRKKMTNIRELENILSKAKGGDPIMLLIRRERNRDSQEFIVTLRIPE